MIGVAVGGKRHAKPSADNGIIFALAAQFKHEEGLAAESAVCCFNVADLAGPPINPGIDLSPARRPSPHALAG